MMENLFKLLCVLIFGLKLAPSVVFSMDSKNDDIDSKFAKYFSQETVKTNTIYVFDFDDTILDLNGYKITKEFKCRGKFKEIIEILNRNNIPWCILTNRNFNVFFIEEFFKAQNIELSKSFQDLLDINKVNTLEEHSFCQKNIQYNILHKNIYFNNMYESDQILSNGNKGVGLKKILSLFNTKCNGVIFVDDDDKNCKDVINHEYQEKINLTAIYYPVLQSGNQLQFFECDASN